VFVGSTTPLAVADPAVAVAVATVPGCPLVAVEAVPEPPGAVFPLVAPLPLEEVEAIEVVPNNMSVTP
jgi:hypothetical protein